MLPTEQPQFLAFIASALAEYSKAPAPRELEDWWTSLRKFSLRDVERAIEAHQADEKDGKHSPRPIDVKRRLATVNEGGSRCAATSAVGSCQYPGIFSDATSGEGSWYCPWHRVERSGPEADAWIERSHKIPYEVARAKRIDRMNAEAQGTAAVRHTAHAIALRHGQKPWQGNATLNVPSGYGKDEAA